MSADELMAPAAPLALPVAEWPDAERIAWEQARAPKTRLFGTQGSALHLRDPTAASYSYAAGLWLAYLQRSGSLVPSELPAERFTIDRLNGFVAEMAARGLKASSLKQVLINLHAAMRFIAPLADLSILVRPRGISLDKALPSEPRVFTVQDRRVAMDFILAMQAKALAMPDSPQRRRDLRDGALLGMLIEPAPRRGSVPRMRLDRLVHRGDGCLMICLRPEDTKTRTREDLLLDRDSTRLMADYLQHGRSGFPRAAETDHLWMGMKGPMTVEGISQTFEEFCLACFGVVEGPHAARRWFRSEKSRIAPESAFDAAVVLGHSLETSLRHYTESNTLHAGLRQGQRVARARAGVAAPAEAGGSQSRNQPARPLAWQGPKSGRGHRRRR